ncbi:MAG: aminotransferase class III-fold pyridoxal phosphate-dependent enzyme [Eubacterium sp.]|nr:aminotransferase class III-fold pyridoxal phosphate-dependent enzyme [Eubacterium sp.]
MGKGQELYKKAKTMIPGGTQLLSKRPEMFAPDIWPAYYSKAKGCKVWDIDGREYIDVSYMGIGANVLGYADDVVDQAVKTAVDHGSMCTLNAPEEVYLAEKLLELHPWAGGVRYAKAGGESMALAIRIARAFSGKDIILFCGYHGWHDWYLAANLSNGDSLADQHLAGLEPSGVPKGLAGTNIPFHYNNIEEFKSLVDQYKNEIAAVVMEPVRNDYPQDGFLEQIRTITEKQGIVLIFDEITAGFRLCTGGSHLSPAIGVSPDMAVFGKGLTNGYPLAAIIGKKEIMDAAQGSFISSTFYTERIGFVASLTCIEEYQKRRVWEKQSQYGKMVKAGWERLAEKYDLPVVVGGIDPLAHFHFETDDFLAIKTFITQEMLKRGYLASNAFYASDAHSPEIIENYLQSLDEVFEQIKSIQNAGERIADHLMGPVCQSGFQRLN